MYAIDDPRKRPVGFKLSEGMELPAELEGKFKFARQKRRLAGTIRGSFFVIKGEYLELLRLPPAPPRRTLRQQSGSERSR